jgi:hypothetical protein
MPAREESIPVTAEDQELRFAFAAKKESESLKDDASFSSAGVEDKSASLKNKDHSGHWSMSHHESTNEQPFTIADRDRSEKIVEPAGRHEDTHREAERQPGSGDNIFALDPYRDQQVSIAPYLTLFGLLVLFYSFVAVFNYAHPTATEGVVRQIPLIGSSVLKNNHLKDGVMLQSFRTDYQTIQGNREVFIITGVVLNQNPVKIRQVRVAGQIYNDEGKEIERQIVWIGNAISAKIVRGMTAQDISNLQRLPPLKTFDIPPGDSVPFTIVFLRPAKGVKDFTCAVVAAEGEVA